ncbi:MAG: flavin reductase family protein [Burkholderiaceae bacterium]
MHVSSSPAILYFGTPVVLIASVNEDGSHNLAPMSSAFWLGWRCVIGLAAGSKTTQNLQRSGECVLNLPSVNEAAAVNRLALTTGSQPVPSAKQARGYRHVADKFGLAGLTPQASETMQAARARECPVQMEAVVEATHGLADRDEWLRGRVVTFELRIQRVHLEESILVRGERDRVDPDQWRPLIMSFQRFYGLAPQQVHDSALATIPEALYRSPDVDRARATPPRTDASLVTPRLAGCTGRSTA